MDRRKIMQMRTQIEMLVRRRGLLSRFFFPGVAAKNGLDGAGRQQLPARLATIDAGHCQRQAERSAHLSANHSPPVIVRLQGIHVAGWLVPPLPAPSCSSGGERHLLCI